MTFAEKLKSLRKERGLTQTQLASATNLSLGVIADVESGRRGPSKEMAKRLSEFFSVPVETFILENAEMQQMFNVSQILMISDIVAEYLKKHGFTLTQDQRATLINHFYQMNLDEPEKIKRMLTFMADTQFGLVAKN